MRKRNEVRQHCSDSLLLFFIGTGLNHSLFPPAATKDCRTHDGEGRKCNGHRYKNAARTQSHDHGQDVSERNFPEPEHEEVDDCRRPGVAGAVERLSQHHTVSVEEEAVSDDSQTIDTVMSN